MSILINFLLTIHVIVCLLLVLVVLMQRPKSEGLGAAFGGGFTENIFGAGTTDVLQKFTTWMAGAFFLLTVVLIFLYAHQDRVGTTSTQQNLLKSAAPAPALATPAPTASKHPGGDDGRARCSGDDNNDDGRPAAADRLVHRDRRGADPGRAAARKPPRRRPLRK